jgi:GntR family transcriptional regulator, carbon starvation induced regulator
MDKIDQEKGQDTLATSAYSRLRHEILTSVVAPGAKLRIRELCDRYEMSVSPIREALNRVSREGLVIQSEQRGFSVAPLSIADLEELTRTRCWISEIAIRESIKNGGSEWEEGIVVAYHRMSRTVRYLPGNKYNSEWEPLHRAFHISLISACKSQPLLQFFDQLFDSADRYRFLWRPGADRENAVDPHREIMDAMISRDADRAVERLNRHFTVAADRALDALRQMDRVSGRTKSKTRK